MDETAELWFPTNEETICPACGEWSQYCSGHGEIGDPFGHAIVEDHYEHDKHNNCHENADCQNAYSGLHDGCSIFVRHTHPAQDYM